MKGLSRNCSVNTKGWADSVKDYPSQGVWSAELFCSLGRSSACSKSEAGEVPAVTGRICRQHFNTLPQSPFSQGAAGPGAQFRFLRLPFGSAFWLVV